MSSCRQNRNQAYTECGGAACLGCGTSAGNPAGHDVPVLAPAQDVAYLASNPAGQDVPVLALPQDVAYLASNPHYLTIFRTRKNMAYNLRKRPASATINIEVIICERLCMKEFQALKD